MKFIILVLLFILTQGLGIGRAQHFYEEKVKGESTGKTNERYKKYRDVYDSLTDDEKAKLEILGKKDFKGDNSLLPYPRIISEEDATKLKAGVAQRGKAVLKFFQDYYSGKKDYSKKGILPERIVQRIVARAQENGWEGYVTPESINFWYGPDIIRGPTDPKKPKTSNYRIVEDNTAFIGGVGDLKLARESLIKNIPGYGPLVNSPIPDSFYDELAKRYFEQAKKHGGQPILIRYVSWMLSDNEDKRIQEIFAKRGIKTVIVDPLSSNDYRHPRLVTDEKRVWLVEKTKSGKLKKSKVGYVVCNANPYDLELSHPGNKEKYLKEIAEEIVRNTPKRGQQTLKIKKLKRILQARTKSGRLNLKSLEAHLLKHWKGWYGLGNPRLGVDGIFNAAFSGKIGMSNIPGMEFINDKEFYIYMDDLIRFYLKEEPIIPNIKTGRFVKFGKDGKSVFQPKVLDDVLNNFEKWVIKGVDGRGGDAVWVGAKLDKNDKKLLAMLRDKIKKNPERFIFQEYTPLSIVDGHIVDARLHAEINHLGQAIIAPVPWGRAISTKGDGKVNLSSNGKEITILVDQKKRCSGSLISDANQKISEISLQ